MSVETLNRFRSLESHNYDLMIAFVEAFVEIFLNMTQSQVPKLTDKSKMKDEAQRRPLG